MILFIKKLFSNIRTTIIAFLEGNKFIFKKPFAIISVLLFAAVSPLCSAVFYDNASSYSAVAPIELVELMKKADDTQKKITFCFELNTKEKVDSWSSNTLSTFFSKHGFRTSYSLAYLGNDDYSNVLIRNEKIYDNHGFSFPLEAPLISSIVDFRYYNSESTEQEYFAKCYVKKYLKDNASVYNYNRYADSYPNLTTGVIASSSFCDRLIEEYLNESGKTLSYDDFIGMAFSSSIEGKKYDFVINNIFYSTNESGDSYLGPKIEEQFGPSFIADLTKIDGISEKIKGTSVLFQDSINLELMLKKIANIRKDTKSDFEVFMGNVSLENQCSFSTHLSMILDKYYSDNFFSTNSYVLLSILLMALIGSVVSLIFYLRDNGDCCFKTLFADCVLFFAIYRLISYCALHGKYTFIMFFNIHSFVFPVFLLLCFIVCRLIFDGRKVFRAE